MNAYETLGVSRGAPEAVIKAAYRALMKTAHPDAGGSAEEAQRINDAYDALMDPERRAELDREPSLEPPEAPPVRTEPRKPRTARRLPYLITTVLTVAAVGTALLQGHEVALQAGLAIITVAMTVLAVATNNQKAAIVAFVALVAHPAYLVAETTNWAAWVPYVLTVLAAAAAGVQLARRKSRAAQARAQGMLHTGRLVFVRGHRESITLVQDVESGVSENISLWSQPPVGSYATITPAGEVLATMSERAFERALRQHQRRQS